MDKKALLKPVFVIWEDAFSIDEWTTREELLHGSSALVHTCGFLIEDNEHQVIVTLNHDISNDNVSCVMVIPKDMVRAIISLENDDPQSLR